jgi:hypothetical protein
MTDRFDRAQDFVWKNARRVDRATFDCIFGSGSGQAVLASLKAYQNPDGGFGNALEPDKRDPHSQPVDVALAFHVLEKTGLFADPHAVHELVLPACDFLATVTTDQGGVPFALPTVNGYPHAPWWTVPENPPASLNPTAELAGMLLQAGVEHPWLERAVPFCWQAIAETETDAYHDLMPMIAFLEYAPDCARAQAELGRIAERIRKPGVVEYDPQAGGYVKMPLDWAPFPNSFCRRLFDDATLRRQLAALAAHQQDDGSWPISWDPISPGVDIEWRGMVTTSALQTLQAYESEGFIV